MNISFPVLCTYLVLSYFTGSIPWAYIFVRLLKGKDIREFGSGNVGATNTVRVLGKGAGLMVFVLDLLKGLICVTVMARIFYPSGVSPDSTVLIMSGACAIAGHIWPVFLNFKGGKGVATTAGVLAGISPAVAGTGLLVWIAVFFIWKYVSLASISAAASLPLAGVIMGKDIALTGFLCVVAVMGVFSHRDNIRRLIKGTESRLR